MNPKRASGPSLAAALIVCALPALASFDAATDVTGSQTRSVGQLTLQELPKGGAEADTPVQREAITLATEVDVRIDGLLADVTLTQRFRNPSDRWQHARYLLPMPEQAVVRSLRIDVGSRTIHGRVRERDEAQAAFAAARQAGQIASLVAATRPNLFTTHIANVPPGDDIDVVIDLVVPVRVQEARARLALPTTLTPRFTGQHLNAVDARAVSAPVLQPALARGPRVHVTARRRDGGLLGSRTHALSTSGTGYRWSGPADADVVLDWPVEDAAGVTVTTHGGHRYAQLLLAPPPTDPSSGVATDTGADELVLVLDRSGSMAGEPMRAAKAALHAALDRLQPATRFNLIAFDDGVARLFEHSQPATPGTLHRARQWLQRIAAGGGTEIGPALQQALATSAPGPATRIVFMTDGAIGYEDALLDHMEDHLQERRVFTVGIGAAPNRWFLERAARLGRGEAVFVSDAGQVQSSIERLLVTLRTPVLTQLSLDSEGGHVTFYPDPLPDLYAGRPVMVVARLEGPVEALVLTGQHDDRTVRTRYPIESTAPMSGAEPATPSIPALATTWAARRIAHLERLQRVSGPPDRHRDEILDLSLGSGALSRYTRFVAIEERVSRPSDAAVRDSDVAHRMPAGAMMQSVVLPQGALGIAQWLGRAAWAALSAALLGVLALWRPRARRC